MAKGDSSSTNNAINGMSMRPPTMGTQMPGGAMQQFNPGGMQGTGSPISPSPGVMGGGMMGGNSSIIGGQNQMPPQMGGGQQMGMAMPQGGMQGGQIMGGASPVGAANPQNLIQQYIQNLMRNQGPKFIPGQGIR